MIIEAFDDMIKKCAITPNEHVFLVKQEHKHSFKDLTTCLGCGQLFVQCIFTVTKFLKYRASQSRTVHAFQNTKVFVY